MIDRNFYFQAIYQSLILKQAIAFSYIYIVRIYIRLVK